MYALVADQLSGDEPGTVVAGIETDRGPWVQALFAAGYQVFAMALLRCEMVGRG